MTLNKSPVGPQVPHMFYGEDTMKSDGPGVKFQACHLVLCNLGQGAYLLAASVFPSVGKYANNGVISRIKRGNADKGLA